MKKENISQKRILKLLKKEGVLTTKLVSENLHIPHITAFRALDALTKQKKILRIGKGRSTSYIFQTGSTLPLLDTKQKKLDAYRPLPKKIVDNLVTILTARFIQSSSAIEGTEISLRETDMVLSGMSLRGKRREMREVKNQKKAIELIEAFAREKQEVTESFILSLQKTVTADVVDVFLNGKYRDSDVGITGKEISFPSAQFVPQKMQELVAKIRFFEEQQQHPAKIAAYAHYQFVAIHPFFDGNGRTARLLMNAILLKHDFPMAIISVSQRKNYYDALEAADHGFYEIFEAFVFHALEKSLDLYLEVLEE